MTRSKATAKMVSYMDNGVDSISVEDVLSLLGVRAKFQRFCQGERKGVASPWWAYVVITILDSLVIRLIVVVIILIMLSMMIVIFIIACGMACMCAGKEHEVYLQFVLDVFKFKEELVERDAKKICGDIVNR
jgi:hypothetical protein